MGRPAGPDQAHSWVIALAAFVINTLLSGISRGTGIFYLEIIRIFGVTRMEANVPFSLRYAFRSLFGPVVGMLGQKYGVQIVTFIGGILSFLGLSLCYFATSVNWISIYWGVLHGLGVCMANTLFQATVNQYFVKHRTTATGLALSGGCLGAFFFPSLLDMLVYEYGLFGAFLLTGGIIMHVLPASIILKEPPWLKRENTKRKSTTLRPQMKLGDIAEDCGTEGVKDTEVVKSKEEIKTKSCDSKIKDGISLPNHTKFDQVSARLDDEKVVEVPFYGRSTRAISVNQSSIAKSNKDGKPDTIMQSLWKVYSNPMFHMISLSFTAFAMLIDPLLTIIVDYVNDKGLNENVGKYLVSILSLGDLIGRICFGWVIDKNFMTLPTFMLLNQCLQGVCFLAFPMFYSFETLTVLSVVYGVTAGCTGVIFPILVVKYVAEQQPLAIGSMAFFNGLVSLTVPFLIGHFRDQESSYDGMLYICGGLSILVGLMWLLEPWILKFKSSNVTCFNKRQKNPS